MSDDRLRIAHRVWAELKRPNRVDRRSAKKRRPRGARPKGPDSLLVFDTETTIDHLQCLTFGCWRYYRRERGCWVLIDEGLFHADDLASTDPEGFEVLSDYVARRQQDSSLGPRLRLLSRSEFVEKVFFRGAYKARARVVGFNLPFDLSRLAVEVSEARDSNFGGFSLILWHGKKGADGRVHKEQKHRPRIAIKNLNSKAAFTSFTKRSEPDQDDLIPEDSWVADPHYKWPGRFLDLRTLAFALTGNGYSLDKACEDFGVEGKAESGGHGHITEQYIDYCRQDVAATFRLHEALIVEFDRHPIDLAPEKAYSPASISKAYLAAMGITPLLDRHPRFSRQVLGYAMASFFGGRAECRIRRVPVPVALVDFVSMYPSVDALMDLHRLQIAESIEVTNATAAVRELLAGLDLEACFDPELWPQLVGFALIQPDGDILPVRAAYDNKTWGIGVNPVTSDEPLWYSLPDLVASTLLTGKPPKIIKAIRLTPIGVDAHLQVVNLRGTLEINPMEEDPMVAMVQERQRVKFDLSIPKNEREWLSLAIKLVVNAGSYGIYSEFNAQERRKDVRHAVRVFGRKAPFDDRIEAPEDPGRYSFPPFASIITGAARLMLAMLETCVTEPGGSWAFCDTDSMAIVASVLGGLVPCQGGPHRLDDGTPGVMALTLDQVEAIRQRFNQLNPYDRDAVPDILKLEATATCFAVSAKRYALYDIDDHGVVVFPDHKVSEHGLGHFIAPWGVGREWIDELWKLIIVKAHGVEIDPPEWMGQPTLVKTTVTSLPVLRAFRHLNEGQPYAEMVKPFNFVLTAAGAKPPAGIPLGSSFRLVGPYETDSESAEQIEWIDLHHPHAGTYRITTRDGRPGQSRVDTFREVLATYETHPEAKSLGPDGRACGRATVGLLQRRPVVVGEIVLIGKESNQLEKRARGELSIDDVDMRLTVYRDHDEWHRLVLPRLREMGVKAAAELLGMSERRARDVLTGRALPHHRRRAVLSGDENLQRPDDLESLVPGRRTELELHCLRSSLHSSRLTDVARLALGDAADRRAQVVR